MNALKTAIIAILLFNAGISLYGWLAGGEFPSEPELRYERVDTDASEGLDLTALTSLVKEVRSGQELERRLNEKESINNLDLNGDRKVDYLSVSEFGDVQKKIGYSLLVEPAKNESQEIAAVTVERNGDRAEIQVVGNEQIYGDGAVYNDWAPVERQKETQHSGAGYGFPLLASYFLFRPLWISPWSFGYYPPYFSPYPMASRGMYANRVQAKKSPTVRKGANSFQKGSGTSIANPNRGKTASRGITRSLKKPTSTQRRFQTTQRRTLKSGGFGRSGSGSAKSAGLFGSGRTGSFRSSSSRSRSFSYGGK